MTDYKPPNEKWALYVMVFLLGAVLCVIAWAENSIKGWTP